jgi:ketosteroid isomerase-like protein
MDDSLKMIADLEAARRAALVAVDKAALETLLSDTLIWTHANGSQQDKASYIAAQGVNARFLSIEPVEEKIAVYGDAAAIVSELSMSIQPTGKDPIAMRTRASSVWAREPEGWRLVRFHSGMIS